MFVRQQEKTLDTDTTDKTTFEHLNSTSQLVIGLMARCGVLNKGHKVYMDNFYSSLEQFTELEQMNMYACGTVSTKRLGTPRAIQLKRRARRECFGGMITCCL